MIISIVIPAHNEEVLVGRCIESILKSVGENDAEVIVVNNASTDNTASVASSFKNVKVVNEPQKGLLFSRQRGYEESTGEIIAYVDADSQVTNDWYTKLERTFVDHPDIIAVSGPFSYYDVGIFTQMFFWFYWNFIMRIVYLLAGYLIVGANFAVKKSALSKIGGFDRTIEFYGEDVSLAKRLNVEGKVFFNWDMRVVTSPRRLKEEGMIRAISHYVINFLSVSFNFRPVAKKHRDIR